MSSIPATDLETLGQGADDATPFTTISGFTLYVDVAYSSALTCNIVPRKLRDFKTSFFLEFVEISQPFWFICHSEILTMGRKQHCTFFIFYFSITFTLQLNS